MTFYTDTKALSIQDLGNGLLVRPSMQQDIDDLLQLVNTVFSSMLEDVEDATNTYMTHLVRRVMSGEHPSMGPTAFTVIEDTRRTERRIVGCTGLLHHTWEYAGIPFLVGRPEVIATYPEYRQQGLIRAIFNMAHARSAAQGHLVQVITGIPYFYRLFDYEYALDLWDTSIVDTAHIPALQVGAAELYILRDAVLADIPLIQELYEQQRSRSLVSQQVTAEWWGYQIQTWRNRPDVDMNSHVQMIIHHTEQAIGYLITPVPRTKTYLQVWDLAVADTVDLQVAMLSILRALYTRGEQEREALSQPGSLQELRFMLSKLHPVYAVLNTIQPQEHTSNFAWYVRVADLPQFLTHIAPVLESRLADANLGGFDGELMLDFYRSGLSLVFEQGRLLGVEAWQRPVQYVRPDAGFPPNVFLQLLFGHRSLAELRHAFPDVWVRDDVVPVLQALFPAQSSWILPLW